MSTAQTRSAPAADTGALPASETRASRATWAFAALVAIQLVLIPAVALGMAGDARQVAALGLVACLGVGGVLLGSRAPAAMAMPATARRPLGRRDQPARLPASPLDTDHLTGVLSREGLISEAAAGRLADSAVIVLDLARMRAVNTRHGHAAGDRLLRAMAGRLVSTLRPDDLVARWGGDEFAIVLPAASRFEAGAVLARIEQGLEAHPITAPCGEALKLHAGTAVIAEAGGAALAAAVRDGEEEIHAAKHAGPPRRRA